VTVGSSTIRRDECNVDENGREDDAGHKDNRKIDAVRRSTCFMRLPSSLSDSGKLYNTTRRVRCR